MNESKFQLEPHILSVVAIKRKHFLLAYRNCIQQNRQFELRYFNA
jgi:hypothetical protein